MVDGVNVVNPVLKKKKQKGEKDSKIRLKTSTEEKFQASKAPYTTGVHILFCSMQCIFNYMLLYIPTIWREGKDHLPV